MQSSSPFAALLDDFAWIVRHVCARLAARGVGRDPLPTPLVLAAHGWLARSSRRLAALVARFEAGRLRPTPARRPAPDGGTADAAAPGAAPAPRLPPRFRLPSRHGWLLPLVPPHAAIAGSQLSHLLAQPQMQPLIAGAPTLGRIMRPLARMLGMTLPPELRLPPRAPRRRVVVRRAQPAPAKPGTPPRATIIIGRDGGVRLPRRHIRLGPW